MFHRHGAEAARAAHNREVTRSKRVAGIFQFAVFRTATLSTQHPFNRCGAEEARGAHNSEVRCSNHLAGIFQFAGLQNLPRCLHSTLITGMAQGKRAGLITPRSLVRSQFPVFSIRRFTESATLSTQQHTPAGVAQRKSA